MPSPHKYLDEELSARETIRDAGFPFTLVVQGERTGGSDYQPVFSDPSEVTLFGLDVSMDQSFRNATAVSRYSKILMVSTENITDANRPLLGSDIRIGPIANTIEVTTPTGPTVAYNDAKNIDTSAYNTSPKGLVILGDNFILASQTVDNVLFAIDITDRETVVSDHWTTVNNADDKTGMCLTDDYLWAANYSDGKIYCWDRTTEAAVASRVITTRSNGNNRPIAVYSPDGERIICSQDRTANLFTYNIDDGTEDTTTAYSFTLNSALTRIDAMWGYDDYIWFIGAGISTAYCHSISTGLEITAGNFALDSGNDDPTGMTGSTALGLIVVSDRADQTIYNYDLTIGQDVTEIDAGTTIFPNLPTEDYVIVELRKLAPAGVPIFYTLVLDGHEVD